MATKLADVKVGQVYNTKVSGRIVHVRVDAIRETNKYIGFPSKNVKTTVFDCTNLYTGKRIVVRSAQRFRRLLDPDVTARAEQFYQELRTTGRAVSVNDERRDFHASPCNTGDYLNNYDGPDC